MARITHEPDLSQEEDDLDLSDLSEEEYERFRQEILAENVEQIASLAGSRIKHAKYAERGIYITLEDGRIAHFYGLMGVVDPREVGN